MCCFQVFSHVEEYSGVRFSQLCKLSAVFYACYCFFMLLLSFILREPRQQKHQSYINEEVVRCKAPAVIKNRVSFQNFIICLR